MGRQPYADAAEHLFAYLERASWLLGEPRVDVERAIERDDEIAAREALSAQALPLIGLRARAGLDQPATHVLVMAAITGLDVDLGALLVERTQAAPSVQQIISLLAFASADEAVLLAAFAPDAPLRAFGLIELRNERAPLLHRTVHVDDRVIAFLRGEVALDHGLADFATLMTAAPNSEASHAVARLLGSEGPIVVDGAARVGKTAAIVAAAASHGKRTLVADLARLSGEPEALLHLLERLRREAMLLDAVFVVRLADVDVAVPVARRLAEYAQRGVAILTVYDATNVTRALRGPRVIRVANPTAAAQVAIWRGILGDIDGIERVVERYPLPPGDIELAAAAARAQSQVHGRPLAHDDLMAAARHRLMHRLGEVAELVSTTLTWDDLVVRDDVDTRLVEIVAAVRFQSRVMNDWGFSAKLPYGRSLSVLFSGAPGTGKTMVATLIGKELGLEVFRVDLSKIVSKYIGETEKNLARVFEEASRCNAVILFDEADSLFAKRTEVKSSNDRYANLEVNFLLQRLEAHDGIVILTTNAANSIDPAFLRRIRYRVEFPEPDEHERKGLWRSMVPVQTPLASDVDFAALGRKFRLTGGHIKNAVVRAAFLAAAEGTPAITQDLLLRAAQLEWTELGNLPGV